MPVKLDFKNDGPKYSQGKTDFSKQKKEHEGPDAIMIKTVSTAPCFSFGSRFNNSIRSKNHLKPDKKDGPGPGSYEAKSSINAYKRSDQDEKISKCTFGDGTRNFINIPKNNPAPNNYYPHHFTEASSKYSFPKSLKLEDTTLKNAMVPGPGSY